MKLCIIQGAFLPVPPLLGGAVEKMWYQLSKEFCQRGHDVCYISRRHADLPDQERCEGIEHTRVSGFDTPKNLIRLKFLDLLYSRRAIKCIPDDADVVITSTFWAPILMFRQHRPRTFVDVQRMPKGQIRFYKGVGRLRANSTPVANAIQRELPNDLHKKVSVIPNPLPFTPADAPLACKSSTILYCGRVHPEKGLELLVRAVNSLESCPKVRVVGPWKVSHGGGGKDYLDRLRQLDQSNRVEFIGPIFDPERLNQEYKQAMIFVYPSVAERGETFGLAPLEAMAWGCVPIVSSLACFRDFIKDNENGLFFDHRADRPSEQLAMQIKQLIASTETRERLAEAARDVCKTHSSDRIADQFLSDFERMIAEDHNRV